MCEIRRINIVGNEQLRQKCVRCLTCGYSSKWREWGREDYHVAIGTINHQSSFPRKYFLLWQLWRSPLLILIQERLCKDTWLLLRSYGPGMWLSGGECLPNLGFELLLCHKQEIRGNTGRKSPFHWATCSNHVSIGSCMRCAPVPTVTVRLK